MEEGKAYIVLTPIGLGKTKQIDVEFVNLCEGDKDIMMLGHGIFWLAKNNNELASYIGMREFEKILFKKGDSSEHH
tara:strand:+ start:880 stop:1107 length:228 start_codon:yes stop_codon:yes gene_type:complete